jgi:hypothetical protein
MLLLVLYLFLCCVDGYLCACACACLSIFVCLGLCLWIYLHNNMDWSTACDDFGSTECVWSCGFGANQSEFCVYCIALQCSTGCFCGSVRMYVCVHIFVYAVVIFNSCRLLLFVCYSVLCFSCSCCGILLSFSSFIFSFFLFLSVLYNYNVCIIPVDGMLVLAPYFFFFIPLALLHFVDVDLFVLSVSFARAFCVFVGLFCFMCLPACLHILYIVCHDDVHYECFRSM